MVLLIRKGGGMVCPFWAILVQSYYTFFCVIFLNSILNFKNKIFHVINMFNFLLFL